MTGKSKTEKIAGAILAGGKACRAGGITKGALQVGSGVSIIEHLINELHRAGISDIVIIANEPKPYQDCGVKVIADIRKGIGPVGGIESGLAHFAGQSDAVMFVPCDMPNITAKQMRVLKKAFVESQAPAVFAETSGFFWHPLCVVVHNGLKEVVSAAIDRGQRKIRDIWQQAEAVRVQFADEAAFFNINSLEDVDMWRKAEIKKRICVEVSTAEQLREFIGAEGIKLEVITDGCCDVTVVRCDGRRESDLSTVYSGGWIECETARALAKKLQITVGQTGKLLNYLDVKIRRCGLGCFQ